MQAGIYKRTKELKNISCLLETMQKPLAKLGAKNPILLLFQKNHHPLSKYSSCS
jgi:hypothetical protein